MNRIVRFKSIQAFPARQGGMVLLVSLVFLLLLTLLGISSMQNATLQEKMAGSVTLRNQSFQKAEAALRLGESSIKVAGYTLAKCTNCAPPAESATLTAAGVGASGVSWLAAGGGGFYGIQNLGTTATPVNRPPICTGTVTLYRVTSVAIQGTSRTVLESIYANC
ncbi:pilus assembly protein PilX [Pseudomonas syringae]|uniref:Pilus assembly protein PilX n=1 Tax=Pseudomonas syringae TaxID=317 RepID=A0A6B2AUG2_PSESX|nr:MULTISPECIES: PilX N-terminal domain-containing pilus assembly protein [Pseudomonas]KFE47402.1 pilus assembly protein PilX [Pseudomonas congelans]MBI6561757.1 pilus assembly protein PilX [Pseudomonas syringae]MBI6573163.1 pilus assembly protein PilX [Pseudomonas syringae]MBI6588000.1 pilus assembly protein PilX [Pseudomonas syringae]MBI6591736.1 pilus assembly protein PilX [Pseudomonas syringae]